jgi:hypothetical protein
LNDKRIEDFLSDTLCETGFGNSKHVPIALKARFEVKKTVNKYTNKEVAYDSLKFPEVNYDDYVSTFSDSTVFWGDQQI